MTKIKYVTGNLFKAINEINKPIVIPHICNDIGAWGAGFVVPLAKHFPKSRFLYNQWANWDGNPRILGNIQTVTNEGTRVVVVNMIGQHKTGKDPTGRSPIRYSALCNCLNKVRSILVGKYHEIHAPKFGSGLAGGDWNFIEALIQECWCDANIPVTIYSL